MHAETLSLVTLGNSGMVVGNGKRERQCECVCCGGKQGMHEWQWKNKVDVCEKVGSLISQGHAWIYLCLSLCLSRLLSCMDQNWNSIGNGHHQGTNELASTDCRFCRVKGGIQDQHGS